MRRILLTVGLLALGAGGAMADEIVHYGPAPSWVKPPLAGALPKQDGQPALGRLSEEDQTRFTRDGVERHHVSRVKVLTADGLSGAGAITDEWDPATETLTINRLAIVRDGQTIDILATEKFQVLRRERSLEDDTLDGRLTATLQIADLRVGDVIDYAHTTTYAPKLLAGRHADIRGFVSEESVGSTRIRAVWDKAAPIQWRAGDAMPKPIVTETATGGELLIEADGVTGKGTPTGAPPRYGQSAAIQYSQFKDWGELSALFFPLYESAATLEAGSPLKAEAARIRQAAATPRERAALALKLVQEQVRYVAIQMDAQGYTPAKADETWRRRFGDCKGKTAVLIALLRELGIEAQPAVVRSEGGDVVSSLLPQAGAFDHVITRVSLDGEVYWLDGTRLGDGAIDLIAPPDFRWALPLTKTGAGLEKIAEPPLDRPQYQSILRIDVTDGLDKPAKVEESLLLRGDVGIALARLLPTVAPARAREYLIEEYGEVDWATFSDATWRWNAADGLMTVTLKGKGALQVIRENGEGHIDLDDSYRFVPPVKLRPADEDQAAPYGVPYPTYARYVTVLKLPEGGARLAVFGDNFNETVGGFEQTRNVRMVGPYAVMTRSLRTVKPELSPAEMAEAVKRVEGAESDHAGVWATPKPARKKAVRLASLDGPAAWEEGMVRLGADDYAGALEAFDAASRKGVKHPILTLSRAGVLMSLERYDEMSALLTAEDEQLGEHRFRALWMRTSALREQSRLAEAAPFLDREIAQRPSVWAYALRGEVKREGGDTAEAVKDLQAAAALDTDDPEALRILGASWMQLDRWEDAVAAGRRVLRLSPESYEYWNDLAVYQMEGDRHLEALASVDEMLRIDPLNANAHTTRAEVLAQLGRRDEASAELDAAIAILPDDLHVLNAACWTWTTRNIDAEKGLATCERGLKLKPDDGVLLDSRGFAKLRLGRDAEALADYERAVKLKPDQFDSLYGRGMARIRTGATAAGHADLAAAEKADPGIGERWKGYGLPQ